MSADGFTNSLAGKLKQVIYGYFLEILFVCLSEEDPIEQKEDHSSLLVYRVGLRVFFY